MDWEWISILTKWIVVLIFLVIFISLGGLRDIRNWFRVQWRERWVEEVRMRHGYKVHIPDSFDKNNPEHRAQLVRALLGTIDATSASIVRKALKDPSPTVRKAVLQMVLLHGLSGTLHNALVPSIKRAQRDRDKEVRELALKFRTDIDRCVF